MIDNQSMGPSRSLDAEIDSKPGSPGSFESKLNTCNSGKVLGLDAGAYAELPSIFHVITDLVASQLADGPRSCPAHSTPSPT